MHADILLTLHLALSSWHYPILQIGKLRLIEVMELGQDYTATVRQRRPRMEGLAQGGKKYSLLVSLFSQMFNFFEVARLAPSSESVRAELLFLHKQPKKSRGGLAVQQTQELGPWNLVLAASVSDY